MGRNAQDLSILPVAAGGLDLHLEVFQRMHPVLRKPVLLFALAMAVVAGVLVAANGLLVERRLVFHPPPGP